MAYFGALAVRVLVRVERAALQHGRVVPGGVPATGSAGDDHFRGGSVGAEVHADRLPVVVVVDDVCDGDVVLAAVGGFTEVGRTLRESVVLVLTGGNLVLTRFGIDLEDEGDV